MDVTFYGATGTVTGSRSLVEVGGKRLLVDCGLFQGYKQLRERNWAALPFDAASLDAVLLTHAHIDHSGALPLLVREGFRGTIWTTQASAGLAEILLQDTAHLQEEEARYRNRHGKTRHAPAEPLYTVRDAARAIDRIKPIGRDGMLALGDGVEVQFTPAGHILGASSVRIAHEGRAVLFSGDLGRNDDLVMRPPQTGQQADWVVIESTYGDRLHAEADAIAQLGDIVRRTVARGGSVLIPAFAVGRTQALLYALYRLRQDGAMANVPVVLDSPMGIAATGLYNQHRELHRLTDDECEGIQHMTRFVRDVEESKALMSQPYPMVILAGSGMLTGGRALHHLAHLGPHSRHTVVLSGYQAGGTRGADLAAGARAIKLFGEYVPIRAEVAQIERLSAHADQAGLLGWLRDLGAPPKQVFITHGEPHAADALRLRIQDELGWQARVPDYRETFRLT